MGRRNPALGFLDYVHRQGAGMVDIDDAILVHDDRHAGQGSRWARSQAGPAGAHGDEQRERGR